MSELDKSKRKWTKLTEGKSEPFESQSLRERLYKAHKDRIQNIKDDKSVHQSDGHKAKDK